jgi:hypothetical protein
MKNKTTKIKSIVLSGLILSQALFAGGIFFENPPKDSEVLKVLEKKVSTDYNNMFTLDDYKRLNGYWKDKLNGKYTVEYNYKLTSKHDIISKNYMSDVSFYYRLNTLKFNSNIYRNESFVKEEKMNLIYTESGWKKDESFMGISF